MSYLYVTDGWLLNFAEQSRLSQTGELHCENGYIVYCGDKENAPQPPPGAAHLCARDGLLLPGFVNTHTHAAMTLFRGLADDMELHTWLTRHIFPMESRLTGQAIYWGSLLACVEMIKSGITCFADMYYSPRQTVTAVRQAGLRAVLGETLLDALAQGKEGQQATVDRVRNFVADYAHSPDIMPSLNLHAVYTCSPGLLRLGQELAEEFDINIHMHLCETIKEINDCQATYGCRPVAHLKNLGLVSPRLWVAHGVWIEPDEATLLAAAGVGLAHCPNSNMKLASGRADVPMMQAAGIKTGLGTDGCASNNRLDMFSEMDICAKLHKLASMDPASMPAALVLQMATAHGAEVLKWPQLGRLQVGMPADFIVVNTLSPHMTPLTEPASHLVYAAMAADVRHTVCQGKVLMRDRHLPHLDEAEIMAKAAEQLQKLR